MKKTVKEIMEDDTIFERAKESNLRPEELMEFANEILSFLPKGSMIFLIFAGPAFEAYGYPMERYKDIISGAEPKPIDVHILSWAYELAKNVYFAWLEKKEYKRKEYLKLALNIALQELEMNTASKIVEDILSNIIAFGNEEIERR